MAEPSDDPLSVAADVRLPGEPVLRGRDAEQKRLATLLDGARAGHGAALALRGEAGIGKTSLLAATRARHDGTTLAASGIEAEMRLPFAVLHALLEPLLGALALGPAANGDRFAVCLATLSLLRAAGERGAVLAMVDDVQWVDRASAE